jgi:hypothetical protein
MSGKNSALEAELNTTKSSLSVAHDDLRELELELRRAGSDNDILRGEIQGIHQRHDEELGKSSVLVMNMKKELETKTNQFSAQLRASDHRLREVRGSFFLCPVQVFYHILL